MSITPDEFLPRPPGDEWVPPYTETDEGGLQAWAESVRDRSTDLQLPITRHPGFDTNGDYRIVHALSDVDQTLYHTHVGIITSFYSAIQSKKTEVIVAMVQQGLVSPDVMDWMGRTPLLAAVDAGNATALRTLVDLGAEINGYGFVDGRKRHGGQERTALQLAASKGNLALVKLLMEECGADDSMIAPDGQMALRLAADNGHREIVDYLPIRRGGEWRRWKTHHDKAMKRIRKALKGIYLFGKCLFWYLPKAIVYWIPKYLIVLPIRDGSKWAWKNKNRFGGWCKKQALALPGRVKRVAKGTWKAIKAVPKEIWKFLRAIPGALKLAGHWLWATAKKIGGAVATFFGRAASFVHTILAAVADFFRNITLKDVWNGFCNVLHAIFVGFPKAVWSSIEAFGELSYKVLRAMFGFLGELFWWLMRFLIWFVTFIPEQIFEILVRLGGSLGKALHEIRVWINPKV